MKKICTLFTLVFCLNANAQIISTVAGNGTQGYSGDGSAATNATLYVPWGIATDGIGNIYVADRNNNVIRKINTNGIIYTIAGKDSAGYMGDGGAATNALLNSPYDVAIDITGNVYVADEGNSCVRKINTNGVITTFAGNGTFGYSGDGGYATDAMLVSPSGIAIDGVGNVYIADMAGQVIREVDTNGIISTIAGNGTYGYSGDGGLATNAILYDPSKIAVDAIGNIYFSDYQNNRVRKIDTNGIITTFAGNGTQAYLGDGGAATNAALFFPQGLTIDASGNVYIADAFNNRIRMVNTNGIISTIAGNGGSGYAGDGALAVQSQLSVPMAVALDNGSNLFIVDENNNVIRKVSPALTITVNSATLCAGNSATLTANGANTYSWSPSTGLSATTGSLVVANPTVTTTYTVIGTKGDSMSLATSIVTINAITVNSPAICMGTIDTLTAAGASTCTWSTGSTSLSIVISPTVTTTYTVSGTVGTCTSIVIATVTVNSLPGMTTPTITPSNCNLCNGTVIGLNGTGGSGTYYYALNGAVYSSVPSYSWCAGTFYYAVVDSVTGCYSPTQIYTIPSIGSPTVSFALVQDTVPHTWDVYPSYSANIDSATWYWGDGDSTIALYPSHTYAVAGLYNICLTVRDTAGCIATYCQNDSVYRTNSIVQINVINNATGISQILDLNSNISIYPNPSNGNFVIEPQNTLYNVRCTVYDINGKAVLTQTINGKTNIVASNLNEGIYNISLLSNEGVVNKRLVIVR